MFLLYCRDPTGKGKGDAFWPSSEPHPLVLALLHYKGPIVWRLTAPDGQSEYTDGTSAMECSGTGSASVSVL